MQLFYLLSFVGVVSHAAALPQPAELSDKYSNGVDTNLAFGLEARSYQPCIKPPRGFGYFGVTETTSRFFKDDDFTSANISSTIDRVKDGIVGFYKDGEKAEKEIGGAAGAMLKRYIERAIYVFVALVGWLRKEGNPILHLTYTLVGPAKFREIFQAYLTAFRGIVKNS
ncbi:hypothetical protein BASA60_003250 [Batrachochytrium salamandrivorans]|nr:hypothetical protein BASA60_003250 [Batrachochytrium salamandrivorans]